MKASSFPDPARAGVLALLVLAGCHKKPPPPEIRPVRPVVVQPSPVAGTEDFLTGQVAPHRIVSLSLRVPGKIVERQVAVKTEPPSP